MYKSRFRIPRAANVLALVVCVCLTGCAQTRLVDESSDLKLGAMRLKHPVVMAVTSQANVKRLMEEIYVTQLKAVGVDAMASYTVTLIEGQANEPDLRYAVKRANADALIVTRLIQSKQAAAVAPPFYRPGYNGLFGWYSSAWLNRYEPTQVAQSEIVSIETSVYDLAADRVVWSGTVETAGPSELDKATFDSAELMIRALRERGAVPSR